MTMSNNNIEKLHTDIDATMPNRATETSIYVTDLLAELQIIARIGGLKSLSDDIELILVKHMSGRSIL